MPWARNYVPKYRKHQASGQAVVTIKGEDIYLGLYGTKASDDKFKRVIAEHLANGRSGSFGTPSQQLTIVELLDDYLTYAEGYYGTHPKGEYPQIVRSVRPLMKLYGRTAAEEFGPQEFKTVRQTLITPDRSRKYINDTMRRIAAVFKWGVTEGRVPESVYRTLALVPGLRRNKSEAKETEPIQPVEDQTVEATLPFLSSVVADMVELERLTGVRPAEVCILRPCDLDRSADYWVYRPAKHKTERFGKIRPIVIGPKARQILLRYLARDSETYCFRPCDSEEKRRAAQHIARTTPLKHGNSPGTNRKRKPKRQPGQCYTTDTYRRAIHRACDQAFPHPELGSIKAKDLTDQQRAELKRWRSEHRWSPNQLRHTAGTEVRKEFGLEGAQVFLGHSHADVTQIYAERDFALAVEIARRIG